MANYDHFMVTVLGDENVVNKVRTKVRDEIVTPYSVEGSDVYATIGHPGIECVAYCDAPTHGIDPVKTNIRDRFRERPGLRLCGICKWGPPSSLVNLLSKEFPTCEFVVTSYESMNGIYRSFIVREERWYVDALEISEDVRDQDAIDAKVEDDDWCDFHHVYIRDGEPYRMGDWDEYDIARVESNVGKNAAAHFRRLWTEVRHARAIAPPLREHEC